MAARTIPVPRRTPYSPGLLASRVIDDVNGTIGLADNSVLVLTTTGIRNVDLPDTQDVAPGTPFVIGFFGPADCTVTPAATDDIVPPAAGAGVLYSLDSNGVQSVTLIADPANAQWVLSGVGVDVGAIRGNFSTLGGSMRGIQIPAFGQQAGQIRATAVQTIDGLLRPAGPSHILLCEFWDDALFTVPSAAGVLTVGAAGTALSGSGTNAMVAQTDATGLLNLNCDDGGAPGNRWLSVRPVDLNNENAGFYWMMLQTQVGLWV